MKTFTYTQKKWAMASALLLVLGFNVSFNNHTGGIASLDLASEADNVYPSKITTSKGVANVKYIKTGEKEVLALVPKVTEGKGYCDDCGFTQYTLNVAFGKNTKDLDALNVALLAKIEEEKGEKAPKVKKEEVAEQDEVVEKKSKAEIEKEKQVSFTQKKLDQLNKECRQEETEKFDCLSKGLSEILATESWAKKIDQKTIQAFVRNAVVPQAKSELNSTTRPLTIGLKIKAAYDIGMVPDAMTVQEYYRLPMTPEQAYQKRDAVLDSMSRFIETVPGQFEDARKLFIMSQSAILQDEANGIQQQKAQAGTNPNLQNDSISRTILLQDLQVNMGRKGYASVSFANSNSNITDSLTTQYQAYFEAMMKNVMQTSSGTTLNVPGGTLNPTPSVNLPADLSARFAPGRGIGINSQALPTAVPSLPGTVSMPNTTMPLPAGPGGPQFLPANNLSGRVSGLRAQ